MQIETKLKPYRVLSLDGGGMRGLYTATTLHTLMRRYRSNSEEPDKDIGKAFDLIVGTSTGGILATALASGISTQEIIKFYVENGNEIFPNPMPSGKLSLYKWAVEFRKKPSGSPDKLKECLTKLFGTQTILSMYKKRNIALCIPVVNVGTNKAWVFKTPHVPSKHRDDNYSLVDVCMATSAAPIFFPLHMIKNPDTGVGCDVFGDGGLWANNPVLIGLIEALEVAGDRPIEIISVGTCPPPSGQVVTADKLGRGVADWDVGIKIVETSIDAQASGHQFMASFLTKKLTQLGKSCTLVRLPQNPPSSEQIMHLGLDKASEAAVCVLSQLGKSDGEVAHSWSLPGGSQDQLMVQDIFKSM